MIYVTDSNDNLKQKQASCRFVCVSDTHGKTSFSFPIPNGDVFGKLSTNICSFFSPHLNVIIIINKQAIISFL